ncbi:MAG: sigma-54 dependent transcriptional regulator [Cytophagaceae bacterium]
MSNILIIEDDSTLRNVLDKYLTKHGHQVLLAETGKKGNELLSLHQIDIALIDIRLPDVNGLDILSELKKKLPSIQIIMMTFYDDVRSAVKAIKLGAKDYLTKPINPEELLSLLTPASTKEKEKSATSQFVVGTSSVFSEILNHATLVAPTNLSVLITGESGVGKEELAKYIHQQSLRNSAPFITVDCGSLSEELFASELFGHVKGAFTGALQDKTGLLEQANSGTLFLDELGNLSYENQIKLLRVIQEKRVRKVGSTKESSIDVRLIAATNDDIIQSIKSESFREDLYHRLNEFKIHIPSLRERKEDIQDLIQYFLNQSNREFHKSIKKIDDKALEILMNYHYPGNIRELKNIIRRATLLTSSSTITLDQLPEELQNSIEQYQLETSNSVDLKIIHEANEKEAIVKALKECANNKSKAARMLNIDRKTLYNKMKLYQLD